MSHPARATLTAMHLCLPPGKLGQTELAERFGEKAVADIAKLSSVTERRIAAPEVTSVDLAACAARRLGKNVDLKDVRKLFLWTLGRSYSYIQVSVDAGRAAPHINIIRLYRYCTTSIYR